jgi:hypothetical protein
MILLDSFGAGPLLKFVARSKLDAWRTANASQTRCAWVLLRDRGAYRKWLLEWQPELRFARV